MRSTGPLGGARGGGGGRRGSSPKPETCRNIFNAEQIRVFPGWEHRSTLRCPHGGHLLLTNTFKVRWCIFSTDCSHLVHAGAVQSHYGSVRQSVKHSPHRFLGVQFLWLEEFLHEAFVEHGSSDVMQNWKDTRKVSVRTMRDMDMVLN